MRIKQIEINGLFDMFNHTISLNNDSQLTIVYGENGIGKTMAFKILEYFFNLSYTNINKLFHTPFSNVSITFVDETKVFLEKSENALIFTINKDKPISIPTIENKKRNKAFNKLVEMVDMRTPFHRVGYDQFLDPSTDEVLSLDEVLESYSHIFPDAILNEKTEVPDKLKEITKKLSLYFIQTQRLLSVHAKNTRNRQMHLLDNESYTIYENTATNYSNEISKKIKEKTDKYRKLSDDLKNSLSNRILNSKVKTDYNVEELKELAHEVEEKRKKYIAVGLIEENNESFEIPNDINDLNKAILAVNIQDMLKQLEIYEEDNFFNRLELFIEILNNRRLTYKSIKVSENKGFTFTNDKGKELKPESLSSGEQHELVLLYQLLFKIPENSLILIDEPEISLHITWQKEFTNDMEDIIKLRKFDILLATHSPAIINGNWGITQSLNGYEETE